MPLTPDPLAMLRELEHDPAVQEEASHELLKTPFPKYKDRKKALDLPLSEYMSLGDLSRLASNSDIPACGW